MITELAYMAVILAERVAEQTERVVEQTERAAEQSSGSSSGVIAAMVGIAAAIVGALALAVKSNSKEKKDSGNATKQEDAEVPISKADAMRVMALLEALDELNHPDRGDKE